MSSHRHPATERSKKRNKRTFETFEKMQADVEQIRYTEDNEARILLCASLNGKTGDLTSEVRDTQNANGQFRNVVANHGDKVKFSKTCNSNNKELLKTLGITNEVSQKANYVSNRFSCFREAQPSAKSDVANLRSIFGCKKSTWGHGDLEAWFLVKCPAFTPNHTADVKTLPLRDPPAFKELVISLMSEITAPIDMMDSIDITNGLDELVKSTEKKVNTYLGRISKTDARMRITGQLLQNAVDAEDAFCSPDDE